MKRALWWIKRDFRLRDNAALSQAVADNDEVLPLFVFEPGLISEPDYSPFHVWAWRQALQDLKQNLKPLDSNVLVAKESILTVLSELHQRWPFETIYAHEETGNAWTFARDIEVAQWCRANQIKLIEIPHTGVVRRLKSRDERPPIIRQRLLESTPLPVPQKLKFPPALKIVAQEKSIPPLSDFFAMKDWPNIEWNELQKVSETQGQLDLASFLHTRGHGYSG